MTTEVTQAEKREALARWEGWEFCSQGHWYRPVDGSCAEQGGIIDFPDYFHDGNAMLRLLEKVEEEDWMLIVEISAMGAEATLQRDPHDDMIFGCREDAKDLPAAVAEAVWEAIQ